MKKANGITTHLGKGEVSVYDFGTVKLHAYKTNDFLSNEVFLIEKDGALAVLEAPCFTDNIQELSAYIGGLNVTVEGLLLAYHMAGASFLAGKPVYTTANAEEYGHAGGGRALIDQFAAAFGAAFDSKIYDVTDTIDGDNVTLAGVRFAIIRTPDAFDIEIPEINAVYTHMLGHDCHSIVAGSDHADAIIAQLGGYIARGYDLILTSHYTPEDLKDAETKIAYLEVLKHIAASCPDAETFRAAVHERYPEYAGENYLELTAGFFFPA